MVTPEVRGELGEMIVLLYDLTVFFGPENTLIMSQMGCY
jgi:hypothetical protein